MLFRFKVWREWCRNYARHSWWHKFAVLVGWHQSPTFEVLYALRKSIDIFTR